MLSRMQELPLLSSAPMVTLLLVSMLGITVVERGISITPGEGITIINAASTALSCQPDVTGEPEDCSVH